MENKGALSTSQRRLNPFKKTVNKMENGRALENLNASYEQQQNNKNKNVTPEQTPVIQSKVSIYFLVFIIFINHSNS